MERYIPDFLHELPYNEKGDIVARSKKKNHFYGFMKHYIFYININCVYYIYLNYILNIYTHTHKWIKKLNEFPEWRKPY